MSSYTPTLGSIPALKDSKVWRIATLCILYVAQGLPTGLFTVSIPSWLATEGYSTAEIATFIGISSLPWSFKFFAGPIMDRFSFLSMGHRRPWVLVAQVGIVLGFLVLATLYPFVTSIYVVAMLGFCINFFCASQDVAVDGMAIGVLEEDERGRANAFMFGGQLAGIAGGSSGGGYLLTQFGMPVTAVAGACVAFMILLVPLLIKERRVEKRFPWSTGTVAPEVAELEVERFGPLVRRLLTVLFVPASVLLVASDGISRVVAGVMLGFLPTFAVQDLGWESTAYNDWSSTSFVVAAFVGVVFGPVIDRLGVVIMAWAATAVKALCLAALALAPPEGDLLVVYLLVSAGASQVFTVAIVSIFMKVCAKEVAASQFAIYMAASNLSLAGGSLVLGALADALTRTQLLAGAAIALCAVPFLFSAGAARIGADERF